MAETTSALRRRTVITRPTLCSASRWEAAHEIRAGKCPDAPPAILLRRVLRADRGGLLARVCEPHRAQAVRFYSLRRMTCARTLIRWHGQTALAQSGLDWDTRGSISRDARHPQ